MSNYESYTKEELIKIIQTQEQELETKKYGLVWDKERESERVVLDCANNLPILKEVSSKHIRTDDSEDNILIEGDNYHSLSVLNYTHKNKIDVIYIDPPYNTGSKDFIYNDRFVDKEDKYRHSKWLNFMEKRLNLAHELLKEDGVIFISIDDNEVFNLKILCDKIFGESNFIANLPTIMNLKGNNDDFGFSGTHEYTLVYGKLKNKVSINHFNLNEDELSEWIEDEYGLYKKADTLRRTGQDAPRAKRPKGWFPVFIDLAQSFVYVTDDNLPKNNKHIVLLPVNSNGEELSWSWGKKKITEEAYNLIITGNEKNGYNVYKKQRPQLGDIPTKKPKTLFYKAEYSNSSSTNKLKELLGSKLFDTPKPINLIKDFIYLGTKMNSIVLDFFAGSGTTGHAVLELNKEDGGNRKFILCTNNEGSICENVTYPRVSKIINGYTNLKRQNIDGLNGNLKYFKTSLLPKGESSSQMKINLTNECSEMLCIKEGIYNLYMRDSDFKIYISNDKTKYLCVYFNTEDNSLNDFLSQLKIIKEKKIIYIFSESEEVDKTIFKGVKNFDVEAIPQKILNIYKQLVKQNVSPKTNTIFLDLQKAKDAIFVNNDKDIGSQILRNVLQQIIDSIAYAHGMNLNDFDTTSRLNDALKSKEILNKVIWEENKTYLAIGNSASHSDYDEYEMKQVQNFYVHVQTLIKNFGIGK